MFEAVSAHLRELGEVYVEPVSVGVFFKVRTTFVQLRPMASWVALMVALPHKVSDPRISRKPALRDERWGGVSGGSPP